MITLIFCCIISGNVSQFAVDGAACFGDSGGPLYKVPRTSNRILSVILQHVWLTIRLYGNCFYYSNWNIFSL
jgi:hypothetical protein